MITCTANATVVVPIGNTDRITQADGSVSLDWSASTSLTVYALIKQKSGLG